MSDDRSRIDPDGRYPSVGLTVVEHLALAVLCHLPAARIERTRDVIQIESGGERGIVVVVMPEAIELRLPTVEWTQGAYEPAISSRLWRRIRVTRQIEVRLAALIAGAFAARRAQFQECRYCHREVPVEHRDGDMCHCCAEQYAGLVH